MCVCCQGDLKNNVTLVNKKVCQEKQPELGNNRHCSVLLSLIVSYLVIRFIFALRINHATASLKSKKEQNYIEDEIDLT